MSRLAVLLNPTNLSSVSSIQPLEAAAESMKVKAQRFEARSPNELESAFVAMKKDRTEGIVVHEDAMLLANANTIAGLALKQGLLSSGNTVYAEEGFLFGYGHNNLELWRRAGYFVHRILNGAKPGDLPVERPSKFELTVNAKTAKALGVKTRNSILARADSVIE